MDLVQLKVRPNLAHTKPDRIEFTTSLPVLTYPVIVHKQLPGCTVANLFLPEASSLYIVVSQYSVLLDQQ